MPRKTVLTSRRGGAMIEVGQIRMFALALGGGLDILGEVTALDPDGTITVHKPYLVSRQTIPAARGTPPQVAFQIGALNTANPFIKEDIEIPISAVAMHFVPKQQIIDDYRRSRAGLVQPANIKLEGPFAFKQ